MVSHVVCEFLSFRKKILEQKGFSIAKIRAQYRDADDFFMTTLLVEQIGLHNDFSHILSVLPFKNYMPNADVL